MQLEKDYYPINEVLDTLAVSTADFLQHALKHKLPLHYYFNNYVIAKGKYPYKQKPPENAKFGMLLIELSKNGKKQMSAVPRSNQIDFYTNFSVYLPEQILIELVDTKTGTIQKKLVNEKDYTVATNNINFRLTSPIEDNETHLRITQNINIKNLMIEDYRGYIQLPENTIEQLIHQESARLEFIKNDPSGFIIICDSDKNTVPLISSKNIWISKEIFSTLLLLKQKHTINYQFEAAKDEWTIWQFSALLANINPERLERIRTNSDYTYSLPEGTPAEKINYQNFLKIINTWSLWHNISSHPYDLINRALIAELPIPEELLLAICAKAANENITKDCYPLLYKETLKHHPDINTKKQNQGKKSPEEETIAERNARWSERSNELRKNIRLLKDRAQQIHDEDKAAKRPNLPPEVNTVYRVLKGKKSKTKQAK